MAAIDRRFALARGSLQRRAQEQSMAEQEALKRKFASTAGLESGAAIKGAQEAERALSQREMEAEKALGQAESQEALQREQTKEQRQFAAGETQAGREFASKQAEIGREYVAGQADLDRMLAEREIQIKRSELDLNEQITLDNLARAKAAGQGQGKGTLLEQLTRPIEEEWKRFAKSF